MVFLILVVKIDSRLTAELKANNSNLAPPHGTECMGKALHVIHVSSSCSHYCPINIFSIIFYACCTFPSSRSYFWCPSNVVLAVRAAHRFLSSTSKDTTVIRTGIHTRTARSGACFPLHSLTTHSKKEINK